MLIKVVSHLQDALYKRFEDIHFDDFDIPTNNLQKYSLYIFDRPQVLYRKCICRFEMETFHDDETGLIINIQLHVPGPKMLLDINYVPGETLQLNAVINEIIDAVKQLDIKSIK
jgi:hypothetical protein